MIDPRAAAAGIGKIAVLLSLLACASASPVPVVASAVRYVRADTLTPALGARGLLIVCATAFPRDTAVANVLVQGVKGGDTARTKADGCARVALPAGPVALRLARMEFARADVTALVRAGFADSLYVRLERHGLPTPAACRAAVRAGRPCM
ncbi:hypothetical protein [Gemmatimonas phototrophica]|uniref:Uncharacterized protein n=1 Tax=Gemmatimonas phototrophica TaxID=1379270 RepID=A0A143BPN8_9BACT|nr:hypothetical protein [Gemmatimonas phototrophica]AMW06404.1 hypothetical protein GEMMAAP_19645 [Gemmatimonas phototrophica]